MLSTRVRLKVSAHHAISVVTFGSVLHRKFARLGGRNACLQILTADIDGDQVSDLHDFRSGSFSTVSAGVVGWLMSASARSARRTGIGCFGQTAVIQTPELGARIMRYELADHEWTAIKPMLPNKPRGVPRVNDRRVLDGIFWVLRARAPWGRGGAIGKSRTSTSRHSC